MSFIPPRTQSRPPSPPEAPTSHGITARIQTRTRRKGNGLADTFVNENFGAEANSPAKLHLFKVNGPELGKQMLLDEIQTVLAKEHFAIYKKCGRAKNATRNRPLGVGFQLFLHVCALNAGQKIRRINADVF